MLEEYVIVVSLGRLSERALLGTSEIQEDELKGMREGERGSADSEQDSIISVGMLADCSSHVIYNIVTL